MKDKLVLRRTVSRRTRSSPQGFDKRTPRAAALHLSPGEKRRRGYQRGQRGMVAGQLFCTGHPADEPGERSPPNTARDPFQSREEICSLGRSIGAGHAVIAWTSAPETDSERGLATCPTSWGARRQYLTGNRAVPSRSSDPALQLSGSGGGGGSSSSSRDAKNAISSSALIFQRLLSKRP